MKEFLAHAFGMPNFNSIFFWALGLLTGFNIGKGWK